MMPHGGCLYCERVMIQAGSINSHLTSRRRSSTDGRNTKRHLVRRKSSIRIRDHSSQCDIVDIIKIPQQINSMQYGVQSKCALCSLDLRIYTVDSAVKSTLLLSDDGSAIFLSGLEASQGVSHHGRQGDDPSVGTRQPAYLYEDLTSICTIGTGTFGRVKLVQHSPSGNVFALKAMRKDDIVSFHQHRNVISEKYLLLVCAECTFIINLMATYNRPNRLYMLMEYVQGGELLTHMYDRDDTVPRSPLGGFDTNIVCFYGANIAAAFEFLLSKGIIYRDLKPENLLIDRDGYIKVVDFGFAKLLPCIENGKVVDKTYTLCGTPDYLAPEVVLTKGYDRAADYWSLGCLLYELNLATTPFADEYITQTYRKIAHSDDFLRFPSDMDPLLIDLIKRLLTHDPLHRLGNMENGINDIMKDPFFEGIDWLRLKQRRVVATFKPVITSDLDSSNFFNFDEQAVEEGALIPGNDDDDDEYTGSQDYFESF